MSDATVERAKIDADTARMRLLATAQEIQDRLEPSRLLDDAVSDVRDRSARIARTAADSIGERPAAFGAAALAGALLVAHRPILRFVRRLFRRKP